MTEEAAASHSGLMRRFVLTGAAAIAAFSIGMAWLLAGFIESRLLQRDANLSRDFVQSIVDTQGVAAVLRSGGGAAQAGFTGFFSHLAAMPDVLRANLYSPERRVLWSSRPEMVGRVFPDNDELDAALRGEVVVNREDGDEEVAGAKSEHMLLGAGPAEFVENYLPVYDAQRRLVGVVELYRRPLALIETIRSGARLVWTGALAGGLFLFASLAWYVHRVGTALRAQQARLVQAEALAMVGEISASVAHSIRNPLGSLRSSAELQRELGPQAPPGLADEVIAQADRIEHLVRTLLDYARGPVDARGSADLGQALRDAEARYRSAFAGQGKPFEVMLPGADLGRVAVDPVLLAQMLATLLSNAAEATAAGQRVRLSAARQAGRVRIVVEDSGAGIPSHLLAEVGRPFFTSKPRGLGLGLALVRRVADRLGGSLDVASDGSGRGARVTLNLPLEGP